MRYLAAYILATLGGSKDPSLNDLTSILSSVGVEVDKDRANKVISELKGKEMAKLIEEGKSIFLVQLHGQFTRGVI